MSDDLFMLVDWVPQVGCDLFDQIFVVIGLISQLLLMVDD